MPRPEIITQPSPRTRSEWTPATVRGAERMADTGRLSLAADLCDGLMADDRLGGILGTRAASLVGRELTFEVSGDRRKSKRVQNALEAGEDWWKILPESQAKHLLRWGIVFGVGLAQLIWEDDPDTGRVLPRVDVWHPRVLGYDDITQEWSLELDLGRRHVITPGDGQWLLYTPYGSTRPWAYGLWRGLARWWILKGLALEDWGRHSEVASRGVITSPLGTTRAQRIELAQDIQAMGKEGQIAMPPGFDYKLVETSADGQIMYGAQVQMAHTAMAVAVLGSNLSTEVQGGSLAAAMAHADVALSHTRADAETLSTAVHDQVLTWWAEHNFGSKALAPWPMWDVEPPEDLAQRATVLATLSGAVPMLASVGADARAILEEFGVPLTPPGTPLPAPPAPPSPFGALPTGEVRLASGAIVAKTSPFVAGQDYADEVIDVGAELGAEALAPAVDAVLALVREASSLGELRASVLEAYSELDPTELALLLERAFIMADLAGRYAAQGEL